MVNNDGVVTSSENFDTLTKLSSTVSNYVIVECVSGNCKQTTGYIKSNDSYYAFGSSNGGSPVNSSITASPSCTNNEDSGKIQNDGKVCIEGNRKIEMTTTLDKGMILKSIAANGTPFVDGTYNIFVKNGENYVIKDNFKTAGKYL